MPGSKMKQSLHHFEKAEVPTTNLEIFHREITRQAAQKFLC